MRQEYLSRLRYWRDKRVLTQRDLKAVSGVAAATIARLEHRQQYAKPATVRKLAQALQVEPEDLY